MIGDEMRALRHRAMASAASLEIGVTPAWLKLIDSGDWLRRRASERHPAGAHWIQALLDEVGHPWAERRDQGGIPPVADLCDTLVAGLYFLLTVSELFSSPSAAIHKLISASTHKGGGPVDACPPVLSHLASARAALTVNPYLAADHVNAARRALIGHTTDKALTEEITLPFLRRDLGGASPLVSGG